MSKNGILWSYSNSIVNLTLSCSIFKNCNGHFWIYMLTSIRNVKFFIKKALEYDVYHRCLCYFVNQATMAWEQDFITYLGNTLWFAVSHFFHHLLVTACIGMLKFCLLITTLKILRAFYSGCARFYLLSENHKSEGKCAGQRSVWRTWNDSSSQKDFEFYLKNLGCAETFYGKIWSRTSSETQGQSVETGRESGLARLVSTDCPWVSEEAEDGSRIQAEQVAIIFILIGLLRKGASLLSELAVQTHPSVCKENATIWRNTCMIILRILLEKYISSHPARRAFLLLARFWRSRKRLELGWIEWDLYLACATCSQDTVSNPRLICLISPLSSVFKVQRAQL